MDITPKTVVVNVNRHVISRNTKAQANEPVFRIQRGKSGKATMAEAVAILDAQGNEVARFISGEDGGTLLACSARAVLLAHHGAVPVDRRSGVLTRSILAPNDTNDDRTKEDT
ncbi:hypothetical protein BAJUN_00400 [Bajunvirus bajun]|uniref:Uncharacterized protein n=1 Tax=Brevundimonas phage vB_BgoS-Bajun TaxID=2948594 RepID=A0A9E7N5X5_9CAUD|nr:hypothetical protein BAJUN_00400 [Brevundimonas phage vB_BgoS-Bajun]